MAEVRETGHVFGRGQHLIGIITEPVTGALPAPAVVLLNAGIIHRVGPSRVGVELARGLAAAGYRVLRFDLGGIGDSRAAPGEASLADVVRGDIADAIDFMSGGPASAGVVLFGICSGADNAFNVASEDPRVVGLVLIDPTIHSTRGFRLRRAWARLRSPRSWWNVVSGRSVYLRLKRRISTETVRPPGYFGLLTLEREHASARARAMSQRGTRFLYVITGGIHSYCNYPGQVSDSLDGSIAEQQLGVEWRPDADHLLRRSVDRQWLVDRMRDWLAHGAGAAATRTDAA
jgi:pimeloyl-ACP methyl ester carboxylesterase